MSELKNKHLGDAGYKFFSDLCSSVPPYKLVQSSLEEDMYQGFDGVLINQETSKVIGKIDVKNTQDLYFINYKPLEKRIIIRHPLKKSSQAKYVGIVSATNKEFYGLFTMHEWLNKYIKKDNIQLFLDQLRDYDGKSIDAILGSPPVSVSQACLKLKQALLPFLRVGAFISYEEPMDLELISFKLSISIKLTPKPFTVEYVEHLGEEHLSREAIELVSKINQPSVVLSKFEKENYYKINL